MNLDEAWRKCRQRSGRISRRRFRDRPTMLDPKGALLAVLLLACWIGGVASACEAPSQTVGAWPPSIENADADLPAVPLFRNQPAWSRDDFPSRMKISGALVILVRVDESGCVSHARVLRDIWPSLRERALECLSDWRYIPAFKSGRACAVLRTETISLRLGG